MLVHNALGRAAQVARHWAASGCPVVIHVDKSVPKAAYACLAASLSDLQEVNFSHRYRCEWGTWGIVAATQAASEKILKDFPDVRHVYLASGSCLPLRPIQDLIDYLDARPQTDFIESATISDVPWTIGGLDEERFTFRFPFSWKRQRFLFDKSVQLQRRFGVNRAVPGGVIPHMGSQWWCLTRQTLSAILQDPERTRYDRFFRYVWIPDESYFQTLVRRYAIHIESRSLTLSKFDFQGKPHIFYDDHLQLLRRSDCFVARKIWPEAQRLYDAFLRDVDTAMNTTEPNPAKIDRIFAKAVERRLRGRPGLYMQSRFPQNEWKNGVTAAPYSVFQGFNELFENFQPWLAKATGARVHGHLFAPDRAEFADGQTVINGALSDNATLRSHNPGAFLSNLIWNTRGEHQCFQFGPVDDQSMNWRIAKDANAHISVISGAWAIRLFRTNSDFGDLRRRAATLQKTESRYLDVLRSPFVKARIRIWTMADFVEDPMEPLQSILDNINPGAQRKLAEVPKMVDLEGFAQFLQNLKNQGMHPYLTGDFPVQPDRNRHDAKKPSKPYLIR